MSTAEKEKPDVYWKKKLSYKVYESLRMGKMEEHNTGKYVYTKNKGKYLCAGCDLTVFKSNEKVDDSSGYAAFKVLSDNKAVMLDSSFSTSGTKSVKVLCVACGGVLGVVSENNLPTIDDVEQDVQEHIAHINSDSIYFKKNYLSLTQKIILICILCIGVGFFLMQLLSKPSLVTGVPDSDNMAHLQIDDVEVSATRIHIDNINSEESSFIFSKEALLVEYSNNENSPKLRPPKLSDILWLNDFYEVVYVEQSISEVLSLPENAKFALITSSGYLPEHAFVKGFKIILKDEVE